jgi:hypothetical protein
VQKNKSAGGTKKMISVLITSSVDVWLQKFIYDCNFEKCYKEKTDCI